MNSHDAPGQFLGYLYQLRCALLLLLSADDPLLQLSMEKYDDVAFETDGTPLELVQLKHHLRDEGHVPSLSDRSVDLWRTLRVWLDAISQDASLLDHTRFTIITTAVMPEGSAAEYINSGDTRKAYDILAKVAESENKANSKHYAKFRGTSKDVVTRLLERVTVICSAGNALDIERSMRREIRSACTPANEDSFLAALEGWWFECCIKALSSSDLTILTQGQLREKLVDLSHQYSDDDLPIEFLKLEAIDEEAIGKKDRIFIEQLRLLCCGSLTLNKALQDYYRASRQRSSWLRQGLVFANELDCYETKLVDEWEHDFGLMEDGLALVGEPSENEIVEAGMALYGKVTSKDLRIRPRVDAPYVMRGTYHHLANGLKVGWHRDFAERLAQMDEVGRQS